MKQKKQQFELSVIICTKNRARQLATVIQCLGSQINIEDLKWEIVIVDNNSTDNTKEVAYAFCEGTNLRVNYIFEEKPGLASARNAGILASKGSNVLFIDDDVLVPKEFLSNSTFGIKEFPEYDIFGFRVLPDFPGDLKIPFWLTFKKPFNLIQSFLPVHDLGKDTLSYPNKNAKNPIGACFLVRKEVFEKVGPFREDLGAGTKTGLCEDTEFFWYSMMNDFKVLYWPYAAIYHPVTQERLSVFYLHKWYYNLGKSLFLIKNSGRIIKKINEISSKKSRTQNSELRRLCRALGAQNTSLNSKYKMLNIPCVLWMKLLILFMLLPFSLILLFIKRPLYFSSMFSKAFGETFSALKSGQIVT